MVDPQLWQIDDESAYMHYTDNETIMGVEYPSAPVLNDDKVLLVSDMSSNFCSREIDWSRHALVYAGAQKNCGPAGLGVVVIREDLLQIQPHKLTPTICSYKVTSDNDSMYNTPPCWNVYMTGLYFKHMIK